jgi:Fe-S oxidoreductase
VLPIVDMRRYLVNQGVMDSLLQETLGKLGRYGNSFGQSERNRARWTQGLEKPVKDARKEPVEYLWFVGDYASYSAASSEVTRMTAEVFQRIGLDFGIMYDGERNAGNDVRRVGEEGLFEMLSGRNAAALGRCDFKAIVTTDPHSYNTLKNEYPAFGGNYQVVHHTELINELLLSGRLKLAEGTTLKDVTFHDPCYLGRHNGIVDAPRVALHQVGVQTLEMPRHAAKSFCCGAGGRAVLGAAGFYLTRAPPWRGGGGGPGRR